MLLFKFTCGSIKTHALLLACSQTNKAAVIDPAPGSAQLLLDKAQEHHLKIEKILLTHSHWDHIADVYPVKIKTDAPIYIHPGDLANLENPGVDQLNSPVAIQGNKADFLLTDNEEISIGNLKLKVIHTPGHSPGSVCFYCEKEDLLITGDTLFRGSYGNLYLPTGQPEIMQGSLEKLAALPPKTRVIPGHGEETMLARECWLR